MSDIPEITKPLRFIHLPHPHILARRASRPPKTVDQHGEGFSAWLAVKITNGMATMTCAGLFTLLALVALPTAIKGGIYTTIQWTSTTMIQLVALSLLAVGQRVLGAAGDARADQTWKDAEATLHECAELQRHLVVQDEHLEHIISHLPKEVIP